MPAAESMFATVNGAGTGYEV
ncbi:MAG: hypothetical protein QOI69_2030, partial [Pseudonocardiales bacterium]|nr:hypothetical protein [Pseudonocardiales bacterium]